MPREQDAIVDVRGVESRLAALRALVVDVCVGETSRAQAMRRLDAEIRGASAILSRVSGDADARRAAERTLAEMHATVRGYIERYLPD